MKKVINIILTILIIMAIVVTGIIIYNYVISKQNDDNLAEVVTEIEEQFTANEGQQAANVQYNGYDVVGIIEIPSINIKYPIINERIKTIIVVIINWLLKIVIVESNGSKDALIKAYKSVSNFKAYIRVSFWYWLFIRL